MRSTWGWLEVDLQVYFVGTRTARLSKSVIYDIGTKILLLKKCVFFLTGKSRFWKRFWQPFLDLENSKACTQVCNLLNLSDLKKDAKILSKNTKYYKQSENLHATLDSQVPMFREFLPPGGRKIVITRRSWQLQSSYSACADLWTCWIRFWYSRSPKLTKMICIWRFFKFFIFTNFQTIHIFQFWGSAAWGFSL